MIKKLFVSAAFISLAALAQPALARDGGFLIGGSVGQAEIHISDPSGNKFDEEDFAWKIFGGYQFGGLLGVELGYVDFGSADTTFGNTRYNVDASGADVFAVLGLPIGPIRLFGKAGGIYWTGDTEVTTNGITQKIDGNDDDGLDLAAGLGLEVSIFSIAVRAEIEYFDINDDIIMGTLGASWTF
ncbi:MAG: outer membrane beta-barrel protein [Gammaproteobacteria bacterium]